MEKRSKELLQLEHNNTSSSEGSLLICGNTRKLGKPDHGKTFTESLPKSQVLDRVKGFLGVLLEANKNLHLNAEGKPEEYNIEVLNGNESEIIEMDLMLGVTDLHTPEAVAAAEASIAGKQAIIDLLTSASSSESESDDDDDDDDEDEVMKDSSPTSQEKEGSFKEQSKRGPKPSKQEKIVEL